MFRSLKKTKSHQHKVVKVSLALRKEYRVGGIISSLFGHSKHRWARKTAKAKKTKSLSHREFKVSQALRQKYRVGGIISSLFGHSKHIWTRRAAGFKNIKRKRHSYKRV